MRILFCLLEEGRFSKQKKGAIFLYLKAFLNLLVNAHPFLFFKWWFRPELNWRHMDFQSIALPTELQNHWLREKDLNQRPPGYEPDELPDCSIPRYVMAEELGFEPRRQFPDLPVFKTGPFSHLGIPPFII